MNSLNFNVNNLTYSNYALANLCTCINHSLASNKVAALPPCDIYCLIFTYKGGATYKGKNKTSQLPTNSLLFVSCKKSLQFRSTDIGWEACLLFIKGNMLPFYEETIDSYDLPPLMLSSSSPLHNSLNSILQLEKSASLIEELLLTEHVTHILSQYIHQEANSALSIMEKPPTYLVTMKENFDANYSNYFCLDALASTYKISKYRLCREFTLYFKLSPMKYLNKIRIQKACLLLVSTEMHVNEVASAVGYENTTHFIRLFKAQLGETPLVYRKNITQQSRKWLS